MFNEESAPSPYTLSIIGALPTTVQQQVSKPQCLKDGKHVDISFVRNPAGIVSSRLGVQSIRLSGLTNSRCDIPYDDLQNYKLESDTWSDHRLVPGQASHTIMSGHRSTNPDHK
ncbi:hypothetical protein PoB_002322300 [Plakobranchus ocellatus]|uniref:Uncharacterized protein n=1 Tax=Plakobranchus ocellatus TaxID=259542 RepID=A0AAV3ZQ81_9GAST|nr:hypothetical protein PoB_002322300 [Plakobranchus ocellatus]